MEGIGGSKGVGERVKERIGSTYVDAIKANLMVWPAVQLVNFSVVPLEHRVLVVNVVALGWNCYLSWLNSQGGEKDRTHSTKEEVTRDAEKEVVRT